MKEYRYIAGCILDEDRSDALGYIEELLFMAHPYKRELFEAFDGYAESYVEDPADKDDRLYHEEQDHIAKTKDVITDDMLDYFLGDATNKQARENLRHECKLDNKTKQEIIDYWENK